MGTSGMTRRDYLRIDGSSAAGFVFIEPDRGGAVCRCRSTAAIPGGTLDPTGVPPVFDALADPARDTAGRHPDHAAAGTRSSYYQICPCSSSPSSPARGLPAPDDPVSGYDHSHHAEQQRAPDPATRPR